MGSIAKTYNNEMSGLEVLEHASTFENKTFGEIDNYNFDETKKGYHGHVVERGIFNYKPNSKAEADLSSQGIEIKVTPVKKTNNKYVSKERLVLNIIDYVNENWNEFFNSSFWLKNQKLLIFFYEHYHDKPKSLFKILRVMLYLYPELDLEIIKNDWKIISDKVAKGEAHLISERDTMYLAAATKGKNNLSVRSQPHSSIPAKQRAYSLKSSYMTYVFNHYMIHNQQDERILSIQDIKNRPFNFDDFILDKFKPYLGLSVPTLVKKLEIDNIKAKNINAMVVTRILGLKKDYKLAEEFIKSGIIPKTIRIEANGKIKEHMSFPTFKFLEIIHEEWEDSLMYNILAESRFLFIVFKYSNIENDYVLNKSIFWSMSETDIKECQKVWVKTKETVISGVELRKTNKGTANNLPKAKDSPIMHVRPHGQNSLDTYSLPDGREMAKQCFWFKNEYLSTIL